MNLADSERMAGVLEAAGYRCAEDASDAHVLVYNTCSIRDKAEQKVYSALGKQVRGNPVRAANTSSTWEAPAIGGVSFVQVHSLLCALDIAWAVGLHLADW